MSNNNNTSHVSKIVAKFSSNDDDKELRRYSSDKPDGIQNNEWFKHRLLRFDKSLNENDVHNMKVNKKMTRSQSFKSYIGNSEELLSFQEFLASEQIPQSEHPTVIKKKKSLWSSFEFQKKNSNEILREKRNDSETSDDSSFNSTKMNDKQILQNSNQNNDNNKELQNVDETLINKIEQLQNNHIVTVDENKFPYEFINNDELVTNEDEIQEYDDGKINTERWQKLNNNPNYFNLDQSLNDTFGENCINDEHLENVSYPTENEDTFNNDEVDGFCGKLNPLDKPVKLLETRNLKFVKNECYNYNVRNTGNAKNT